MNNSILPLPAQLEELKRYNNWVLYRSASDKQPLRASHGLPASSTDPRDWCPYEYAVEMAQKNGCGIGFVFTNTPYSGIDLDSYKTEDATLLAEHQQIVTKFNSYTEWSPNGGLHILIKGEGGTRKPMKLLVECYSTARYFTVTGHVARQVPIAERQDILTQLIADIDQRTARDASYAQAKDDEARTQTNDAVAARVSEKYPFLWNCNPADDSDRSTEDWKLAKEINRITRNQQQSFEVFMLSQRSHTPRNKTGQDRMKCINRPKYVRETIDRAWNAIDWHAENLQRDGVKIGVDKEIPKPPKAKPGRKATFKRGFEIADAPVDWLWEEYLPRGMFTMLAGESGTGKSTLTCALTAIITTGGTWPDRTKCTKPGNVLIWSSEDPAENVIKPRLVVAGANAYGYATIEATVDDNGNKMPFDPAEDIPTLEDACLEIGNVSLIIIDPILAVVKEDANAANKVRAALQPTIDLAKKLNCAVIGISHFSKGSEKRSPVDRVLNSQAFTALARMNWATAKDESTDECVLTRIKTNIAKSGDGFKYTLERVSYNNSTGQTLNPQRLSWGEPVTGSAREILQSVAYDEKQTNKLAPESIEAARRFIHGKLWNGQKVLATEMLGEAHEAQINEYALVAAKRQMTHVKAGPLEFGGRHYWYFV